MHRDGHLFSNSRRFPDRLDGPDMVAEILDRNRIIVRRRGANQLLRRMPEPVPAIDMPRVIVTSLRVGNSLDFLKGTSITIDPFGPLFGPLHFSSQAAPLATV